MKPTRPHRFANRVGGEGEFEDEYPPCKLIDVGNAKRYPKPYAGAARPCADYGMWLLVKTCRKVCINSSRKTGIHCNGEC